MKTDHFIIYITTTLPGEWSWICHLHAFADREKAKSRKNFLLVSGNAKN
jgi:hypothetical protein